jgi:hypothetical protein
MSNPLTEAFVAKVSSGSDGIQKTAAETSGFIRDRLREVAFVRSIMTPKPVTRADCQVSVNHDTLVKIVELEPKSRAVSMTFRGEPPTEYIRGERIECAFFTISSQKFQKKQEELLAYTMPITKIIEENSVKDLQEIEDREFVINVEAAVQSLQQEQNGGAVTSLTNLTTGTVQYSVFKSALVASDTGAPSATVRDIQRADITRLARAFSGRRMKLATLLMTDSDFDGILNWTVDDNGDRIQSETTVDGYKYNTLLGRKFVRTIKTDILRPGNVYGFADENWLGRFFLLNNTQFYIDKVANMISFQAWETVGSIIANVAAAVKMELYAADATTIDLNSLRSNFVPVDEESLGAVNNRVESGLRFPQIAAY